MKQINIFILLVFILACDNHIVVEFENNFQQEIVDAAILRTKKIIIYNGDYFNIDYPNGDIPANFGVCTDVIIRSYRKLGIDLQQLIHEDVKNNFQYYNITQIWETQLSPDTNIDHRRVPNIEKFMIKNGQEIAITNNPKNYKPGDIVTWNLSGSSPWHIGIVTNKISERTQNPLIVHNIGMGPQLDDCLFNFPIRGHYRYIPKSYQ